MVSAFTIYSTEADDVRGTYWTAEKTAKVRIYRAKNNKYYGKLEYIAEPNNEDGSPKLDTKNPDPRLRSRATLGLVFMKDFEWSENDKQWQNGTIYDAESGKTYDGFMSFDGDDKSILQLRGYVMGMTWLGRTSEWKRIN